MGTFASVRAPDGYDFLQWRATEKGEKMPSFGPGHPANPCCIICGAQYKDRVIEVPARGEKYQAHQIVRTDIEHDWKLHRTHPGIRGEDEPVELTRPRRAHGDDDE